MKTIAKIIPLKRMPRSLGVFDYAIPPEMEGTLFVGQLVKIPLRKSFIVGLIAEFTQGDDQSLKHIDAIITDQSIMHDWQIKQILLFATLFGVSAGVMANMYLPPIQKRKLKKIEPLPTFVDHSTDTISKPIFYKYQTPQKRQQYIKQTLKPNTAWFFASIFDLQNAYDALDDADKQKVIIYNAKLSTKQKFEAWFAIAQNSDLTIFCTRSGVFLPFTQLDHLYLDFEHNNGHKHWDQAPRFHVKLLVPYIQKQFGTKVTYCSFAPSIKTYFDVHKNNIDLDPSIQKDTMLQPFSPIPSIIDMKNEKKSSELPIISFPCEQAIIDTTGSVFIHINKKGYSHGMICSDCNFVFKCPGCRLSMVYHKNKQSLECHYCKKVISSHQKCPKCNSKNKFPFGYGIERLAEAVKDITDTPIIVIDAENPPQHEINNTSIIIGTDAAFAHLPWKDISLVIFANIDQTVQIPEYTAVEQAFLQLQYIQFNKNKDTSVYIQTLNPEHTLLKRLHQPDYFYRMDLNLRMALLYPPYGQIFRFFYGHHDYRVAKTSAYATHKRLTEALTKDGITARILDPIEMHPRWYRRKFWFTIIVKSDPLQFQKNLSWFSQKLSDDWKVDPNPSSLLHP